MDGLLTSSGKLNGYLGREHDNIFQNINAEVYDADI